MTDQQPGSPVDNSSSIPNQGRILGIDFGTVRVGVAVSDDRQHLASPLETYQRVSRAADQTFFRRLTDEYQVTGIVVGLPLHMSGEESEKSLQARSYGRWLQKVTGQPVDWQDERLSSAQADVLMRSTNLTASRRKQHRDKLAAQVILQTWLDRRQVEE